MKDEKNVQYFKFDPTITDETLLIWSGDGTVSIHNYGANSDEEHGWQSGEVNTNQNWQSLNTYLRKIQVI